MASGLTIVIPVWDEHTRLLPRCLQAIRNEPIAADLILVDNASNLPFEIPPRARRVTLTKRQSIGAARNAGLAHVNTHSSCSPTQTTRSRPAPSFTASTF